ncbi:type II toxin-antitoxin system VapC family toxin [Crocosphaera sp. UHCC 0190]|uniref:type II toxin-antitoxin system VapC family toxin n=1 Tax=Crocosphaera sp. UHCC 0190 TaxID=3110246 RepID=UPI002B20BF19|nr:type II toxin-antitoxin system VapC family toxin [Crocosphaera sp. UHCC 0190]MEA5511967.1 type II toxin-antitoxin system VapC family toxin [Crocosphaera sp. UHCC 0190]
MTGIVIDTHVLIWYVFDINRLSDKALTRLDNAVNNNELMYLSAISLIEIIYLVEKGRIADEVLTRVLKAIESSKSNLFLVPLDKNIALTLQEIDRIIVPEMPDRIIAATALYLQLPLITRDLKIQALSNIQVIW